MYSILTLALLTTPIHAATSARVWMHFYPNCPGEPFDLASFEDYEQIEPPQDVTVGECTNIGVPSYEHNLVSAISVDAEMLSREHSKNCNITVHEVPECIDPPLITKEIRNGVEVSQCESRKFAAWSEVWVQLVCNDPTMKSLEDQAEDIPRIDETAKAQSASTVQTPGSTWHVAQSAQSEREPEEESRVNNAGHFESEQLVHSIMEKLAQKHSHFVSGKHNATQGLNGSHHNPTATGNRTISRRKLRNRATRLY